MDFGGEWNTPLAPVNTPSTMQNDPQFKERMEWIPKEVLGADMLPNPVKIIGGELPIPRKAPECGQHSDEILSEVLGYDAARIAEMHEKGVLG